MRILEIIPQLDSGGGERFTVDLCNELAKQHTVRLVVLFPLEKNGFYANEISPQVEVVSMNKKYGIDITLPFKILREIRAFNPDVVQTHLRAITYEAMSAIMLHSVVHCAKATVQRYYDSDNYIGGVAPQFCGFLWIGCSNDFQWTQCAR